MPTPDARALFERLAWVAIYGGILAIILGIVSHGVHVIAGWSLGALGAVAVTTGVVLIVLRSRMPESAESKSPEGKP